MEVGIPQRPVVPLNPLRRCFTPRRRSTRASLNPQQKGGYQGLKPKREWVADWVSKNDDVVRSLPIYIGGVSLLAVLFNRTLSGIAPVADASSSQSRTDLLTLGLAVTNILNGLVWLSIKPKSISVVNPNGVQCQRVYDGLPDSVISELLWAWESLSNATCCRSLVIVYDGICILQIGYADVSDSSGGDPVVVDAGKLMRGSLYNGVVKSGSQSYLANLSLYPAKNKGIVIFGGDTIRGFSTSDQAWITLIGEKLDATLAKHKIPKPCVPNLTKPPGPVGRLNRLHPQSRGSIPRPFVLIFPPIRHICPNRSIKLSTKNLPHLVLIVIDYLIIPTLCAKFRYSNPFFSRKCCTTLSRLGSSASTLTIDLSSPGSEGDMCTRLSHPASDAYPAQTGQNFNKKFVSRLHFSTCSTPMRQVNFGPHSQTFGPSCAGGPSTGSRNIRPRP
ncbi:cofactor assembly of complex C [Striga hermonthica]|uniref:Cofactor assembly of complex C n=1 Tax=Striga hermonthica TaxID=68872 RepID=A0A9N7NQ89_STRHE|nr:cofactor assembly of complex C [Striga hermonthica]